MKKRRQSPTIFFKKNRKGVFFVFLFVLILSTFFVTAANETDAKAYACLESKVADKCSILSSEEKIFSLLAIDRCKTEVLSDARNEECWPKADCKIKTTAQAILALNHVNADTVKAENWILGKTSDSSDLDWFLQVDQADLEETTCTATYPGGSYSFKINENKTITRTSGGSGSCLSIYNKYWLKIALTCYNLEFKISCEEDFLTSLLYKKKASDIFHVSQKTTSVSGEGTTTEKVGSSCFKDGSSCSYEGTLWASFVLKYRKHDVSAYVPYLTAMADENSKYIPESFLYYLTNNFRTELLARQSESDWWSASGDKFYDTAVALLPFQGESASEKTDSIDWLSEVQGTDGCWLGNIRNTAFLLYSIWPKKTATTSITKDCEDSGYDCMSSAACADASGTILTDYTGCFTNVCCNKPKILETCSQQDGKLCNSDEDCLGGSTVSSSDAKNGKSCCIDGTCGIQEEKEPTSECESYGGYCKSSCSTEEDYSSYSCSTGNCCIQKSSPGVNVLVIVILSILIVLVAIGIVFRKKLRMFFSKLKFGKGKAKPQSPGGPRFFPPSSQRVYPGAIQRRIIPQQAQVPVKRPQKKSEADDILKKLKEIGK